MLTDDQLNQELAASPAPRVTKEQIEARITNTYYSRFNNTVTICNIDLDNGFSVRGESACVNPENYKQEIGEALSYKQAFEKLWALFGFLLAEDNFRSKTQTAPSA